MQRPSFGLTEIKNFAINHFEKAIFGLIALGGFWIVYSIFTADSFPAKKVPTELVSEVKSAEEQMRRENWDEFEPKYREKAPVDVIEQVKLADAVELDSASYESQMDVLIKGERLQLTPRFDPVLMTVQELRVNGVYDSILWSSKAATRISQLDEGELRTVAKKKKRKKKKKKKRPSMMMGQGGMEAAMQQQMQMQMQMEMGGAGGPGGPGGATNAAAKGDVLPDSIADELPGVRPRNGKGRQLIGGYFVNVTGVVEFKKQLIEFKKLSNTFGYDPKTDYPVYSKVEIERMDMALPEASRKWTDVTSALESMAENSVMNPPEVCTPEQLDRAIAIHSLPLLRTDPSEFGLHPLIAERTWIKAEEEVEVEEEVEIDPLTGLPKVKTADARRMGMYPNMMAPQMAAAGIGRVSVDEAPEYKLVRFSDYVKPGHKYQYRVRLLLVDPNLPISMVSGEKAGPTGDMAMMGPMGPDPSEMMGMMGGPTVKEAIVIKHGNTNINETNVNADVRARLRELRASERFKSEDEDIKFSIPTPWSEPTEIVSAPKPREEFFAGKASPGATREAEQVRFTERNTRVQLAMTRWSKAFAYRLPVYATLYRGSTLNLKQVIKLIDPVDLKIREIRGKEIAKAAKDKPAVYSGVEVESDAVVLDIMGGEELDSKRKTSSMFHTPAEVLVFDGENFVVTEELDHKRQFRENSLFDVDE